MDTKIITLANLSSATAQEVFDQVTKHLLTQNKRSKSPGSLFCEYKSAEGLKCAAGCLIADAEYKKVFENCNWDCLVKSGEVTETHSDLILELQEIHDNNQPYEWVECLTAFARDWNLVFNPPVIHD